MVLPHRRVPVADLTHAVILPVQRLDRGQSAKTTEILLRQDPDTTRRRGVGLLRFPELETLDAPRGGRVTRARRGAASSDDQHRGPGGHIVGRDTAKPLDGLARLAATNRRQLAREDDDLTVKREILGVGFFRRWLPHRSALSRRRRMHDATGNASRSITIALVFGRGIPPGGVASSVTARLAAPSSRLASRAPRSENRSGSFSARC